MPRKCFNSPKSFTGKDARRNCFTTVIYARAVEAMITSSTYINNTIKLVGVRLMKRLEFDLAYLKPKCSKEEDNLENHCLEACFRPYKLFLSLQTRESFGLEKPSGNCMYTSLFKSSCKKALSTSS
jgi:hypothetical protein